MPGQISKFAAVVTVSAGVLGFAGMSAASAGAISDGGATISSIPEASSGSAPFKGTGVSSGSFAARYVSTKGNFLDPLPSNNVQSRSVIGADGRVRIMATTTYPYRAIAHITFSAGGGTAGCTGWFINKDTLATAGHCVHKGTGGSGGFYPRSSYRIYAGRNASSAPYGTCTAKGLWTNTSWTNGGGHTVDYGAIKLNCTTGNTVGWFGLSNVSTLTGRSVRISGYPGDKATGTQWAMSGIITSSNSQKGYYTIDTFGGQSGSPVYETRSNGPYGLVIHAYGGNPNSGTRINATVLNFLKLIMAK